MAVAATGAAPAEPSQAPPRTAYRKSIALAVTMLAVFGAAITVGLLAGGPIRQAGTGYNFTRATTRDPRTRGSAVTTNQSAAKGVPSGDATQ